ncbi:hypothetical protein HOU03_gp352 [Caulobacter phage CcrSC]|uniref:Uncharacterized protein n=1 Tax=Caulobacter phage CcrSC TaxID=2283272 RepID=A0A385EE15_9CAUD|nr:hypothetical protein HOU03_gp352 [Caulobacter phage CcrSC]AXQ69916.1 hypothetical protein CcrSC_gp334 [Caulobacter phage CcrSC]
MGVKSTVRLSRQEAEERYVRLKLEDQALARSFRAEAVMMTDTQLEDVLERLNDDRYRDEYGSSSGYDNYLITKYPHAED